MYVSNDPHDRRPIGFVAACSEGYAVYQGDPSGAGIFAPTLLGYVPYTPGTVIEVASSKWPNVNFKIKSVCAFCGGPTPCTRRD